MGELMRISSSLWARGRVHPGQVASPSRGNTGTHRTNNHAHTHSFTPKGNLERPINLTVLSLVSGRKQEYLVRTHACMGRTCKLHSERLLAGSQTQESRTHCCCTAVQQCYQLRYCAAHEFKY
ncbi:hypothetical protein ILYODFUR_026555 [Ilyodon furcidens]|uniref:Uncharacterized protein n=1 Tax=Ilyodon furcidens TaxID=33524 RepID=A0ABV0SRY8_9TELE